MTETMYWKITLPPIDSLTKADDSIGNGPITRITCETPEELGGICWALGADGVTENTDGSVRVFITGTEQQAQEIANSICQTLSIAPLLVQLENDENWVQRNVEVLEPITCGQWNILPMAEPPTTPLKLEQFEIAIVPGMGFGTGHHSSTQLALSLLTELKLTDDTNKNVPPKKILDIGTGSGILAIAATKLWPSAEVIATDNDPQALTNAKDTILINNAEKVELALGTIPSGPDSTPFDVITANLYAECLRDLEPEITAMTHPGTRLIQSGVLLERTTMVENAYSKSWKLIQSIKKDEWNAYLWERK